MAQSFKMWKPSSNINSKYWTTIDLLGGKLFFLPINNTYENTLLYAPMKLTFLFFTYIFLLEFSCFTKLCLFLLYRKVNQLYVNTYLLFLGFPSHLGPHRALSRGPYAVQ